MSTGQLQSAEVARPSNSKNSLPEWCRWVPTAALQYVSSCAGYTGEMPKFSATCESYCEWVSSPAWQFPEGCQDCAGGMSASAADVVKAPLEFIP